MSTTDIQEVSGPKFQRCDSDADKENCPSPESLRRYTHLVANDSMTSTLSPSSFPVTTITAPTSVPLTLPEPVAEVYRLHHDRPPAKPLSYPPQIDGVQEEHDDEGEINCICGYQQDDGSTVCCDRCNRWQHIRCYYPDYTHGGLPETMQHFCVECVPRPFNLPESVNGRPHLLNGVRKEKAPTKSHKKKTQASLTNGLFRHDRDSASPRDAPPPAKRPKTSHRSSASTSLTSTGRKRAGTNQRRSTSRSPDATIPLYSEEFVTTYRDDVYSIASSNCLDGLQVGNTLSEWLQEPDEVLRATNGRHGQTDVFQAWPGEIAQISNDDKITIAEMHDPHVALENGRQPVWRIITATEVLPRESCIAELKGHIGFRNDYLADESNRWEELRHPAPFVFFHPLLPLYLDARSEGTHLRYIRRSCNPNARLQVIIIDNNQWHFCFMATRDIQPGEEVAVAWDTAEITDALATLHSSANGMDKSQRAFLENWVSTVMSNLGPCACNRNEEECWMARFDRRGIPSPYLDEPPAKAKRKSKHHISPLQTSHNSRSGTEAPPEDSERGSSGSPNPEQLSARERKKLAREEEIFRKQEEESRQPKKKRNSAGTTAPNTPHPAGKEKQLGFPQSTKSKGNTPVRKAAVKSSSSEAKQPKPEYKNAETQCDLDAEEAQPAAVKRPASPAQGKRCLSVTQRLLRRCAMNNARRKAHVQQLRTPPSSKGSDENGMGMEVDPPASNTRQDEQPGDIKQAPVEVKQDVIMVDAELETHVLSEAAERKASESQESHGVGIGEAHHLHTVNAPLPSVAAHTILDVPAPSEDQQPQPENSDPAPMTDHVSDASLKPPEMHVTMPPPFTTATSLEQASSVAESPVSLASMPMLSPAVSASLNPSPARKKLSLSDYTKRNKASKPEARDTSPSAIPPLVPSASEAEKIGEAVVEEDVKMTEG